MFSSITMASSTTNPTDRVRASKVMLLIEYPNRYMAAQVAIREIGTASAGIVVAAAERKNRKMTSTTKLMAIASVTFTSSTESRIDTERSASSSILTAAGIWAR